MNEVRVLFGIAAAGAKQNLALNFIDAIDTANDELAPVDLVFDLASGDIDEVQMPPAVAFGGVDDFIGVHQPIHICEAQGLIVSGPDEGGALFINNVADGASARIDFNQPV